MKRPEVPTDRIGMAEHREIASLFRQLSRQPTNLFPGRFGRLAALYEPGVYIIRNAVGRVAHVGMTGNLHARLYSHLCSKSSFVRCHLGADGARLRGRYSYQYLEVPELRKRALLEAYATGRLCPIHIRKSQEPDEG
jgi:hypothetical protein